jgi:hypothetical protein
MKNNYFTIIATGVILTGVALNVTTAGKRKEHQQIQKKVIFWLIHFRRNKMERI